MEATRNAFNSKKQICQNLKKKVLAVIWECEYCQNFTKGLYVSWPHTTVPIFFFKQVKSLSHAISQDPYGKILFYNIPSTW